jgi:hypothetical protein
MHALRVTKDTHRASVGLVTALSFALCACGGSGGGGKARGDLHPLDALPDRAPHALDRGRLRPAGALQGRNSFGRSGYSGPCPPKGGGPHHYRFVLYALSRPVRLLAGASRDAFRTAVAPAAMAQGTFRGTYSR